MGTCEHLTKSWASMQVYNNNTAETPQGRVQPANQVCNSSRVAQSALETARDFF